MSIVLFLGRELVRLVPPPPSLIQDWSKSIHGPDMEMHDSWFNSRISLASSSQFSAKAF